MAIPGLIKRNIRCLGVIKPISLGGPTELDVNKTKELQKFLLGVGLYENPKEAQLTLEVLKILDRIIKNWIKKIRRQKGLKDKFVQEANAKISTFGSYRLGVK